MSSQGEHRADKKVWFGQPPATCDICRKAITIAFVDGHTSMGPWANMCLQCHASHGTGLGTGCGQQYEKEAKTWDGHSFNQCEDSAECMQHGDKLPQWVKVRG